MIPDSAKGLRKVALDTKVLMVNVMAIQHRKFTVISLEIVEGQIHDIQCRRTDGNLLVGIVLEETLQRVEGEIVAAMVVNSLQRREGEEGESTTVTHAADQERQASTDTVHQEALEGMIVEGAKGIGHIEAVMARVEMLVKIRHVVEQAVEEILPCVEECHGDKEADKRLDVKVGHMSHGCNGSLRSKCLQSCKGERMADPQLVLGQAEFVIKDHFRIIGHNNDKAKGSLIDGSGKQKAMVKISSGVFWMIVHGISCPFAATPRACVARCLVCHALSDPARNKNRKALKI